MVTYGGILWKWVENWIIFGIGWWLMYVDTFYDFKLSYIVILPFSKVKNIQWLTLWIAMTMTESIVIFCLDSIF